MSAPRPHPARLRVMMRALRAGWCWGVDPRNKLPALLSPRGTVFLLRGRSLVPWRNFFEISEAA